MKKTFILTFLFYLLFCGYGWAEDKEAKNKRTAYHLEKTDIFIISSVRVIDGDTFAAQLNGVFHSGLTEEEQTSLTLKQYKAKEKEGDEIIIRLYGIDAPEKDQPFGKQATAFVKDHLTAADFIAADNLGIDRYGRFLCIVNFDSYGQRIILNEKLVEEGLAWKAQNCQIPKKSKAYAGHELLVDAISFSCISKQKEAQAKYLRIWNRKSPLAIPPWEWRKGKRYLE